MKRLIPVLTLFALLLPSATFAQNHANAGVGEKYWIEFSATWWKPSLDGLVQSDKLGLIGSQIDFITDLGFENSKHQDVRLVLRPGRKHKFRFQYSPLEFTGDSVLTRDIAFAGQIYPVSLPVQSLLTWKVMRVGYEWDFFYRPRGFVGVLLEIRKTDLTAALDSFIASGSIAGTAPLPALGVVGRFYPIRNLAIHLEGSGLKLTDFSPEHSFRALDLEFSATYNVTRNVGVSAGWRRMNTNIRFDEDRGDLNFKGLWLGGVVRY